MHWAKQLTLSARRGEAEAGALMLRLLFQRTCLLPSSSDSGSSPSVPISLLDAAASPFSSSAAEGNHAVRFLAELRRLIEQRLDGFEKGLAAWSVGEGEEGAEIVMVFGAIQVRELGKACLAASTLSIFGLMCVFF